MALVGVTQFKLKRELEEYVRDQNITEKTQRPSSSRLSSYHARAWRVTDRLSEADIKELIALFIAGTAKWQLAKKYGINIKSVKKLLREHGVRKPSGWNPRG